MASVKFFALPFCALLLGIGCATAEEKRTSDATAASAQVVSNLPVLLLEAKQPIENQPRTPCTISSALPAGIPGPTGTVSAVARIHGGVSQGYAKKSYGITLEKPVEWLGLPKSAHWVLNAAFVDRSLMRHKLSYDLFRSLPSDASGKHYAAQSRFVEVRLNGQYQGVYLFMQRVDRALLQLHSYHSNATSHACIYKAVDHAANFAHSGHNGYEQHEPRNTIPYWGPLDEFDRFVSRASEAEFNDPQHGIATRLDLDNAIDFHLLVLLTSNLDGITKNFILARDAATKREPAPRFFFAPWDYDGTFGRNWDASRVDPTAWLSNHLFNRLHQDVKFRKKFAARWKQLRRREFSVATIHGLIDENARTLGEAARRNSDHWHTLNGPYPDRLTFAEDITQMKDWVVQRVKWLDAEIERSAQ